jgi:hypothetical protein
MKYQRHEGKRARAESHGTPSTYVEAFITGSAAVLVITLILAPALLWYFYKKRAA